METNQKNQDESILALMYAEVKKINKHLKIDRRSTSNPDDPETPYIDEGERLLRELVEKMDDLRDRKDFTAEQIATLDNRISAVANFFVKGQAEQDNELKSSLEKIGEALEALKAEKHDSVVEHHHRHVIDVVSSKNFFVLVTLGFVIFVSGVLHIYQLDKIRASRDNDLKYRYIKMHGKVTPGDIKALETIFTYDLNSDSIRLIRRQVVRYERLVKEQAERIEQARLNASEAQRLKREVEQVKKKR